MGKLINRTGETNVNKQGLNMKIIIYRKNNDLDVLFEDGYIAEHKDYRNFINGYINNPNFNYCKKKNRVGETFKTNCGATVEIIEYNNARDLKVKCIETGEIIKSEYNNLKKGVLKPKFYPTVLGVGYLGELECVDKNGKQLDSYKRWAHMLTRVYNKEYHIKQPTYENVSVCKEWLNYSNFKKWYDDNYYEIKDELMALDKDIINKGNKIYSPDSCIFVPQRINSLFIKSDKNRGNLPIGVSYVDDKDYTKKYKAGAGKNYLGYFSTPEEAFYAYKQFKENYIKEVADEYKPYIPQKLYEAMYRYEVEITD